MRSLTIALCLLVARLRRGLSCAGGRLAMQMALSCGRDRVRWPVPLAVALSCAGKEVLMPDDTPWQWLRQHGLAVFLAVVAIVLFLLFSGYLTG